MMTKILLTSPEGVSAEFDSVAADMTDEQTAALLKVVDLGAYSEELSDRERELLEGFEAKVETSSGDTASIFCFTSYESGCFRRVR